jgi:hypothetical protein
MYDCYYGIPVRSKIPIAAERPVFVVFRSTAMTTIARLAARRVTIIDATSVVVCQSRKGSAQAASRPVEGYTTFYLLISASNRLHGPHFLSLISPRIHSYC